MWLRRGVVKEVRGVWLIRGVVKEVRGVVGRGRG